MDARAGREIAHRREELLRHGFGELAAWSLFERKLERGAAWHATPYVT